MPEDMSEELAMCATRLWNWFLELHRVRRSNGFGLEPTGYQEMEAWIRLTGVRIYRWEIRTLTVLDKTFIDFSASEGKSN